MARAHAVRRPDRRWCSAGDGPGRAAATDRPGDPRGSLGRAGAGMSLVPITQVTGGLGGLAATYARVRALADRFDTAGDRMRGWAATGGRTLCDPDLVESAVLSPLTFAAAEQTILAATTGTHGVLVESVVY